MFFSFALLAKAVEQFILDENSHEYVFKCSSGLKVDVMPSKGMSLIIYTSLEKPKVLASTISTNATAVVNCDSDKVDDGLYKSSYKFDGEEPLRFNFECPSGNAGKAMTVVLRGEQNVTSDGALFSMIIASIVIISAVILIVCFQFCTFHHKKQD